MPTRYSQQAMGTMRRIQGQMVVRGFWLEKFGVQGGQVWQGRRWHLVVEIA